MTRKQYLKESGLNFGEEYLIDANEEADDKFKSAVNDITSALYYFEVTYLDNKVSLYLS